MLERLTNWTEPLEVLAVPRNPACPNSNSYFSCCQRRTGRGTRSRFRTDFRRCWIAGRTTRTRGRETPTSEGEARTNLWPASALVWHDKMSTSPWFLAENEISKKINSSRNKSICWHQLLYNQTKIVKETVICNDFYLLDEEIYLCFVPDRALFQCYCSILWTCGSANRVSGWTG